ncbi:MAG: hypothetical protein MZV70_00295 [Desulfobacterales bacterium]|nr:hypothetical protein [Desulfobacterales bacterium]
MTPARARAWIMAMVWGVNAYFQSLRRPGDRQDQRPVVPHPRARHLRRDLRRADPLRPDPRLLGRARSSPTCPAARQWAFWLAGRCSWQSSSSCNLLFVVETPEEAGYHRRATPATR